MKTVYDKKFFENRSESLESANEIVPRLLERINPRRVIDVGCGLGEFLSIFKKLGVKEILGLDGEWVDRKRLLIPKEFFISTDLENPIKLTKKFDLVVSLETGEHLSEENSKKFVEYLTSLGPIVLFSAAIPFQGGTNHINEQWQEYWREIFEKKGYLPCDFLRREIWANRKVCFYYSQNMILYVKKDFMKGNKFLLEEYKRTKKDSLNLVHPEPYLRKAMKLRKFSRFVPSFLRKVVVI